MSVDDKNELHNSAMAMLQNTFRGAEKGEGSAWDNVAVLLLQGGQLFCCGIDL